MESSPLPSHLLSSLMLCFNSFIWLPISSIFERMELDIVWNRVCICWRFCTNIVITDCFGSSESCPSMIWTTLLHLEWTPSTSFLEKSLPCHTQYLGGNCCGLIWPRYFATYFMVLGLYGSLSLRAQMILRRPFHMLHVGNCKNLYLIHILSIN